MELWADLKHRFNGVGEQTIEKDMEQMKDGYMERTGEIKDSFYRSFFELCTESVLADMYEMFLETETESNYFRVHLWELNKENGSRFFKIMALHHAIKIVRKKRNQLDWLEMKQFLYFVYEFNEAEKQMAELLYICACEHESRFLNLFGKVVARYVFATKTLTPFSLAFIVNFCYNSYSSFLSTFTRYLSVTVRLKRVAR